MEESEIVDNAFSLIFAFDEIVALGYRENVNLAQIRTFTEMDSHEEKVFQAVRQVNKMPPQQHQTPNLSKEEICPCHIFDEHVHTYCYDSQTPMKILFAHICAIISIYH